MKFPAVKSLKFGEISQIKHVKLIAILNSHLLKIGQKRESLIQVELRQMLCNVTIAI